MLNIIVISGWVRSLIGTGRWLDCRLRCLIGHDELTWQNHMKSCSWKGAYTPGVETSHTPDVLDANDALQGLAFNGWHRVRRVRRVAGWIVDDQGE